jgi:hypothetical protein
MTTVNPAGITYDTDVTFTSDTSFSETGTVHLSGSDTLRIHTQQDGLLTPSANPGQLHGAVIWRIVGGTGRFEHATGLITTNFVFDPSVGDGIEEQLGVVFSCFGTDKRGILR